MLFSALKITQKSEQLKAFPMFDHLLSALSYYILFMVGFFFFILK